MSGRWIVDARLCLSTLTIETKGPLPEGTDLHGWTFGCDICQEVCPLNVTPVKAGPRFEPRPLATLSVKEVASLSFGAYEAFALGSPLARAGYDGLRRNAALALGAAKDAGARGVLERLLHDASAEVRDAAQWALNQLNEGPEP